MTCEDSHIAISARLDGSLDAARVAALDRHLETCAECAALARDLQQIRHGASTLERLQPPAAVWTNIRAGLDVVLQERERVARTRRRLAMAASMLIVAGVGAFYLMRGGVAPGPSTPATTVVQAPAGEDREDRTEGAANLVQSIEEELKLAEEHYERAIEGLEEAATADQKSLDPVLAATLQKNLGVIDQAIAESRAAVRAQPASQPARESLFDAFRNKVALLQDTIALINEMRKGDDAGTARVMSELAK